MEVYKSKFQESSSVEVITNLGSISFHEGYITSKAWSSSGGHVAFFDDLDVKKLYEAMKEYFEGNKPREPA